MYSTTLLRVVEFPHAPPPSIIHVQSHFRARSCEPPPHNPAGASSCAACPPVSYYGSTGAGISKRVLGIVPTHAATRVAAILLEPNHHQRQVLCVEDWRKLSAGIRARGHARGPHIVPCVDYQNHTRPHARMHTRTIKRAHTRTHARARAHAHIHSRTRMHLQQRCRTQTQSLKYANTGTHMIFLTIPIPCPSGASSCTACPPGSYYGSTGAGV